MHAVCDALGLGVNRVLSRAELKERWRKRRERSSQLVDRRHFVPNDPGWHSNPASHRHQNEHNPTAPNTSHRHKHRVLLVRALQEAPVHAHRADGAEDAPGRSARVARAQVRPAMHDQRVQRLQLAEAWSASSQERAHAWVLAGAAGLVARGRPGGRAAGERSRGRVGGRAGSRSSRRASGRAGRQAIERAGGRASGAAELRRCTIFRLRRRPWRPVGGRCEVEVGDRKQLANGCESRGDAGPTSRWRWRSAAAGGGTGDDAATEERDGVGPYLGVELAALEVDDEVGNGNVRGQDRGRWRSGGHRIVEDGGALSHGRFPPQNAVDGDYLIIISRCHDKTRIPASGVAAAFPVNLDGVPLPPMAFILVHEVQHCNLLVDNHHLSDQKALDGRTAYGFQQVQTMTSTLKKLNPQNYAFLALMMQSNPELFAPTCFIGSPLGTRAPDLTGRGIVQGFPGDVRLDRFENDDYVVRLVAVKEDVSHVLLTQLGVLYSTLMRWIN
ncbi:hypothetical protein GGX14DRAFT_393562 [Mycena pura]|uniref:Uncharacterized protein n=1 Tax=Mycena pura TaxID=153505 RepID=A0AAD6YEP0_9AGAR|nr:hypothetical protein GGX14DRAFT_393562 [Mycena pura]